MEIRIKNGQLSKNIPILNTYAPDSNYEFSEIKEHWGEVNKLIFNQHKILLIVGVLITMDNPNILNIINM